MKASEKYKSYFPNPRDPNLPEHEYYVEDMYGKIQRGWITDIGYTDHDDMIVRVANRRGQIHSAFGCGYTEGWFYKGMLYDNKQDCKDNTHTWIDNWEELRRVMHEES